MNRTLPLVALSVLVAAIAAFLLLDPAPHGPGPGGALAVTHKGPLGAAAADSAQLAEVSSAAGPARAEAPRAAPSDGTLAGALAAEGRPAGSVEVLVQVAAPAGTPDDEAVEVLALASDMGLGRVLGAVDLEEPEDRLREQRIFQDLTPDADRLEFQRAAVLARAEATRGPDGQFTARLTLERGRATWLHAVGTHLRTPQSQALDWALVPEPQRLSPQLGGALEFTLVAGETGVDVGHQRVRLKRANEDELSAAAAPGDRVRQVRRTDGGGRVRFRALPTDTSLELVVLPELAAPAKEVIAAMKPGETRTFALTLQAGASASGVVLTPAGAAASGAKVIAFKRGTMFGFDDQILRETEADAAGRFTLVGLPALPQGKLAARAEHAGWLQSEAAPLDVGRAGAVAGLTLTLREGRAISGQLRFADGRPAAGVTIEANFDAAFMQGPKALGFMTGHSGRGTSGADGAFTVAGLGAGPFVLTAEAPHPTDPDGAPWRVRRDNTSPDVEALVLTLQPALVLSGQVVDDEGAPVGGVEVIAVRTTEGALGKFDQSRYTGRAAPDTGQFRCEGLLSGTYEVLVRCASHVTLEPVEVTLPAAPGDPDVAALVVIAHRTATVRGLVQAPSGGVVAGARITVETGQPEWSAVFSKRGAGAEAISDDTGAFELLGVPPGDSALFAKSEDWARSAGEPLTLAPGELREGFILTLSNGGTLTGDVFDDEGRPAAGRRIVVQRGDASGQRIRTSDGEGRFEIEHLEPGRYQVIALDLERMGAAGATSSGEGADVAGFMQAMRMASADVVDGEEVHVVLGAPPANPVRVSGTVTQAKRGLAGVVVTFLPAGPKLYERMKVAATNADGDYELVLDEPGDYVVAVQRQIGGVGQQATTEFRALVPEGAESRHDFELPGGRIAGRVVDAHGHPAAGARVSLATAGGIRTDQLMGGNSAEISAQQDGTFVLEGLRAGSYRIAAGGGAFFGTGGAEFGRVVRGGLDLKENEAIDGLELRLPEPGELEVTVRGADGTPRTGVTVFVRNEEGAALDPISLRQTGEGGRVVVTGLAPGRYTVSARSKSEAASDGPEVIVKAGERATAALTLEPGTVVRIRLELRGDGEVPPGTIRVLDERGREVSGMFGMTDLQDLYLDGAYSRTEHRLGPLAPGRYTISARSGELSGERRVTLRGEPERSISVSLR
ncbi:MAG: carboxypeptidase-like regulatory domain-containing protein [Planctomycetota bacterium]